MQHRPKLLRITTVPISLRLLLEGQFNFFQHQGFDVLTVSANGEEVNDLKMQGVPHKAVNMTRKITPFHDLLALIALIRIVISFRPDIVHTHTPKAGLLGMMAAWICKVPVRMHTVAGLPLMEASGSKRMLLQLTEYITYKFATKVYPNSKGLLKYISSNFDIKNSKLGMIGNGSTNGIDTDYFSNKIDIETATQEIKNKYAIQANEIIFCFIGRVVRDKGIIELVEAFKQLEVKAPSRLLLVGSFEHDLDPLPNDILHYLQSSNKVILAGFQNDVRPWLSISTVFVFPSYREGFPNVVMQAMCMRVPCIVSDINGCNELVEHQKTGLIVPVKEVVKLTEAMRWMASNRNDALRMADEARENICIHYKRAEVWDKLLQEYKYQLSNFV